LGKTRRIAIEKMLFFPDNRKIRFIVSSFLVSLGILFSSCEKKEDNPVDTSYATPYLSLVSFNHAVLNLNTDNTGSVQQIDSVTYRITILFNGNAVLNASELPAQGVVTAFKPNETLPFAQFSFFLQSTGSDSFQFSSPLTFTIKNTDIGTMVFQFSITTVSGSSSNLVQQSLVIQRNVNHPPVILNVALPDTVVLPAHDSLLIKITAQVSDPDGLGDVGEVFFYSLNSTNPQQKFEMYDDGGRVFPNDGDDVAGDGIYTIIIKIVDTPFVRQVGTFHFEFHAADKEGASATPITKSLTIQ